MLKALIQKLTSNDPVVVGGCLGLGAFVGWTLCSLSVRDCIPGNCLLTKQQAVENLDKQGYKSGPVSICLQFEEFGKD